MCADCAAEQRDPQDRRFRHPFVNCTNCGPRFTIIASLPYDRAATTMAGFPMCTDCAREYHDPTDRRFHAQPICCPNCGPTLHYRTTANGEADGESALRRARTLLRDGRILAVKGIGGYHLACDAGNEARSPSCEPQAPGRQTVCGHGARSCRRARIRRSMRHRVDCFPARNDRSCWCLAAGAPIAASVAPHNPDLGVMLPYTPLHELLLGSPEPGRAALVMTSGNLGGEPICYTDEDALDGWRGLADGWLLHDRADPRAV